MEDIMISKFRPKTLDEVIGQPVIVRRLKKYVEAKQCMHMLFCGDPGIGKTSTAMAFLQDLYGESWRDNVLELNASDERGIDTIRNKVQDFARTLAISDEVPFKVVFLDEADALCLTGETEIITGSLENTFIKKLENLKINSNIMIPSINPKTLQIENDRGELVDSGLSEFYRVEFEDGSYVNASSKHPFFKINNNELYEIKLMDLNVGDEIVELNKEIYNICPECGKYTLNNLTCSRECQNKNHSKQMMGEGNIRYGKVAWNKGLTKEDPRVAKQSCIGKDNGNYGGKWYGVHWSKMSDDVKESVKIKLSEYRMGKTYKQLFGEENELSNRLSRNKNSNKIKIETNMWIEKKKGNNKFINCELCDKQLNVKGDNKYSVYIHHKDGNHENHVPENLMFVCPKCHNMKLHNCQKRFVEKGWEITHRKKFAVHNGIKIIDITYIGTHKAWNISMVKNKNFILKNGVVTHNTINAQATLRRVMEDYSKSNRFILSCNYVHKIISPIQDRCAMFRFGKLDWGHIYEGLRKICKGIKLDISEDAIKVIARNGSKGSMRKALNILEDLYITHKNKQITEIDVDEIVGHTNRKNIGELMKHAKDQNFLEFNNILQVMRIVDKMSVIEIIHEMISYVEESKWPNLVKQRLYYLLAEVEWRCTQGADEWVQMRWLLSQIKDLKDVKEVEENAKDTNGSNNINSTPGSDN